MKVTIVIGAAFVLGGIVFGNSAIGSITDAGQSETQGDRPMFSAIDEVEPLSGRAERVEAFKTYKEAQPNGGLLERLRNGQILVVVGILIWVVGAFVSL